MLPNNIRARPHFQLLDNHFQCTRWRCSPAVLYAHLPSYMLIHHLRQPSASYMHLGRSTFLNTPAFYMLTALLHVHLPPCTPLSITICLPTQLSPYKLTLGLEGSPKVGCLGNIHKNSQNCCLRDATQAVIGQCQILEWLPSKSKQAAGLCLGWCYPQVLRVFFACRSKDKLVNDLFSILNEAVGKN